MDRELPLIVFGRESSDNTCKVLWCLAELEIEYELHRTELDSAHLNGFVLQHNPDRSVPLLKHGDFYLAESNTIIRYLSAITRSNLLLPFEPKSRSQCERWMDWQICRLEQPIFKLHQYFVRNNTTLKLADVEYALEQVSQALTVLDRQLSFHSWIGGNTFSVADICCGVVAYRWFSYPVVRSELPHLNRWYSQLLSRDAFRSHVMFPLQ